MKEKTNVKKFLLLLICLLLALSVFMLAACNNGEDIPTEDETKEETTTDDTTETPFITNMDFSKTTSTAGEYPLVPTSWTATAPSSTLPQRDDEDDAIEAGIISVESSAYSGKYSEWDSLANPGKNGDAEDNNMLMIYNREPTVYSYTSASFTLAADTFYKISIDVKTVDIAGRALSTGETESTLTPGARIYISTATYAQFTNINTNGAWTTYTFYLASNVSSTSTLTILLGLGSGSSTTAVGLTSGYVFFDNITVDQEVTVDQYQSVAESATVTKANVRGVGNGEFEFGTTNSSTGSASLWTNRLGSYSDDDNMAPTSNCNRKYSVVDLANWSTLLSGTTLGETVYWSEESGGTYSAVSGSSASKVFSGVDMTAATGTKGNNIYMLYQSAMTAQYIQNGTKVTIERGKCYELQIYVYTKNVFGAGVSLILTGGDEDLKIEGISASQNKNSLGSTGGWELYTFWIEGNPNRNLTYNLQLCLGTGGIDKNFEVLSTETTDAATYKNYYVTGTKAEDFSTTGNYELKYFDTYTAAGTFSSGWAFFDGITLKEYSSSTAYDAAVESATVKKFDLSAIGATTVNITDFGTYALSSETTLDDGTLGLPSEWTLDLDDGGASVDGVPTDGIVTGVVDVSASEWSFTSTNPTIPYGTDNNVLMIKNGESSIVRYQSDSFTLKKNSFYRIAVWVKTQDVKDTAGLYATLYKADGDTSLSAFTLINTNTETTASSNKKTNGWQELVFKVQGAKDVDTDVYLVLQSGTGSRWTPATLADGAVFFSRPNMEKLTYSDYTNISTGTYVKAVTSLYSTTSSSFTNGAFDNYDTSSLKGVDADGNITGMKDGELTSDFGTVAAWTADTSTLDTDEVLAGIVNTTNKTLMTNLGVLSDFGTGSGDGYVSTIYNDWPVEDLIQMSGAPNLLMIRNTSADGKAQGYKSNSFTLTASTYYKISVWVKTLGNGTVATMYLGSENSSTTIGGSETYFKVVSSSADGTGWTKYVFAVEVGLTSVSDATLSLWLGVNTDLVAADELGLATDVSKGTVLFDSVAIETIDEKTYAGLDESTEFVNKLSFFTDSFDSVASSEADRVSVTTPSKWTGSVVTDGTAANTVSGVVDDRYVEIDKTFGLQYVEGESTFTEQDAAATKISAEALKARTGHRLLVINNLKENGYTFTSGTSYSFAKNSCYKVSVWVKTYLVAEGSGAYVQLTVSDDTLKYETVNVGEWTEYVFYVKTADSAVSPTILLGLGKYIDSETESGFLTGYALFDDISITTVTANDFESITTAEGFSGRSLTLSSSGDSTTEDPSDDDDTQDVSKTNDLAWLWISSIVLAVVIILVVVVYLFRKFYKPRKKNDSEAPSYDKETESSDNVETKKNKYKDFND